MASRAFLLIETAGGKSNQVVEYEGSKVLLIGIEYFRFLNSKTVGCCDTEYGTICSCDRV